MKKLLYLFLCATTFTVSCTFFDSEDNIPAYLSIQSLQTQVNQDEGFNSNALKDVWVYADNELLGVFPVPVEVPIIVNNEITEITLFAGIRNNGISGNPVAYAFLNRLDYSLNLVGGQTEVLNPVFTYRDNAIFEYVEDFEGAHALGHDLDTISSNGLVTTSEEAFGGSKSGKLYVDEEKPELQFGSTFVYSAQNLNNQSVYIELDYKNDALFFVGIVAIVQGQELLQYKVAIPARDDWNKIYVDITDELSVTGVDDYRIAFGLGLEDGDSEGTVYIDNVKLVHF